MATTRSGRDATPVSDRQQPLVYALDRTGIGGFPVEIWTTIATAMAPEGIEYRTTEAVAFARTHPTHVSVHDTRDGARYQLPVGSEREALRAIVADPGIARELRELAGPFVVEDDIALALVELLDTRFDDPGVHQYLRRCLPDQCADGTGRGIGALRALPAGREKDHLLAAALSKRAGRTSPAEGLSLRREAIALFDSLGSPEKAAAERGALASTLQDAGDLASAIRTMDDAVADFRALMAQSPTHRKFLALALLNLGKLHRAARDRRAALAATKSALAEFRRVESEDHRFADEVTLARKQLSSIRWHRR